jgi:hypothetical protein
MLATVRSVRTYSAPPTLRKAFSTHASGMDLANLADRTSPLIGFRKEKRKPG